MTSLSIGINCLPVSRGSGQKRLHSAMINLVDNLSHNSAVLWASFSDYIYIALILLQSLEHYLHLLRNLYASAVLLEHNCRGTLPDGGSTSAQVKGELEVTITHVHSHEVADSIRAMPIVQNDPVLSNRL